MGKGAAAWRTGSLAMYRGPLVVALSVLLFASIASAEEQGSPSAAGSSAAPAGAPVEAAPAGTATSPALAAPVGQTAPVGQAAPAGQTAPATPAANASAPAAPDAVAAAPKAETPSTDPQTEAEPTALESPVAVHGFVSQGFIKTTQNNYLAESARASGSFEFTEAGVNFTKELTDRLRVGVQLFARNLGPIGNYTAQFDWFYLDYRFADWLGIRAGRTKLPFGLYNETSDVDAARVPILLPQSVYPIQDRDFLLAQTGGEIYGFIPLGAVGDLSYRAYGGTLFLDAAYEGAGTSITHTSTPYLLGGRLMWGTPLPGLRLAGSVQALEIDLDYAPPDSTVAALQSAGALPANFSGTVGTKVPAVLWVGSLEYSAGDLLLSAEYTRWHTKLESTAPAVIPSSAGTSERFYGMASYRVTPWLTPGVYYSALFPNVDNRHGYDEYQHDFAATLRFDLNAHWLLKLEGHYMHGTAGLSSSLNDNAKLDSLPADWGVFLAKTTAYF